MNGIGYHCMCHNPEEGIISILPYIMIFDCSNTNVSYLLAGGITVFLRINDKGAVLRISKGKELPCKKKLSFN